MNSKRKNKARMYPQSWGNLALDDTNSWELHSQKAVNLTLVPATREDSFDQDLLGPAKGLLWGIGLSIVLWVFIILGISAVV